MLRNYLIEFLFVLILAQRVLPVPLSSAVSSMAGGGGGHTEVPQAINDDDDDDENWDDDEDLSSEVDDDGRIYKNPRNSPSSDCPRDEEQATLLGQKCLRKCSSDEDCKSKKKKCLCDGVCGMSCIKPDRECPELAQPSLGQVTVLERHFGARASYSCPHGYHVVGLQSRLCQADGNWAGAEPACKQNIYCLKPPQIEHARHSALPDQETFDLDSTVQYHCHTGYVTNGFPRAKCLAIDGQASWYGPDIQCEPRSCGQPPDPANGWHSGECYTYGCKINYNCGTGYELVGKQERTCQSDGSWAPKELPTCVLVTSVICPTPENPKNGKATYTTLAYNSVVSYECRYGYTLVGDSSSRCGADRKWSGTLPSCKEINCGHPGVLYNGWIENVEAGTGLGASIIFRCQPEMLVRGQTSSVCQIDGRWRNPLPECLAPCVVPTISQGYVIPIDLTSEENSTGGSGSSPSSMSGITTIMSGAPTTTNMTPYVGVGSGGMISSSALVEKVRHGTSLEVKCEQNYEFPVSLMSPPTCHNGTWSIIPRCVPARCKSMPRPPKHGMVLAPKTDHGMRAKFKCKDGFKLISPEGKDVTDPNDYMLTCSFGNWTGITPKCQEVFCSFPGYIPNGKVLLVGNMGLYDYRPYVKKIVNNKQIMYDCDKGYVLEIGPPGATCVGGKWRPLELPQCLLGQHPRLRFNRRKRRKRSVEMRHQRLTALMKEYRNIARKLRQYEYELEGNPSAIQDDPSKSDERRELLKAYKLTRPQKRSLNEDIIDKAYTKYYQYIKQKYQNYVKRLLGYRNQASFLPRFGNERILTKSLQLPDSRRYNSYPLHLSVTQGREGKLRSTEMMNFNEAPPIALQGSFMARIPLPNIYEKSNYNLYHFTNEPTLNDYDYFIDSIGSNHQQNDKKDSFAAKGSSLSAGITHSKQQQHATVKNTTDYINQLKSQIIRRRRDTSELAQKDSSTSSASSFSNNTTALIPSANSEDSEDIAGGGRKKVRDPCEDLDWDSFANITTIRPGKVPGRSAVGIILLLECNAGFKLNLKGENTTARCIRGIWKPETPKCISAPCLVPYVENGKYYKVEPHTKELSDKPSLTPLSTYEEIQSNEFITLECENNHKIQGAAQLRCAHGSWSVNAFSECVPVSCTLPNIPGIIYEGGYRSGLTIGHLSSVSVRCNYSINTQSIELTCDRGVITPPTVHCESGMRKSREEILNMNGGSKTTTTLKPLPSPTSSVTSVTSTTTTAPAVAVARPHPVRVQSHSMDTNDSLISNAIIANDSSAMEEPKMCGPPTMMDNALVYKNGGDMDLEGIYESGTEIYFNCIPSASGERNTWKIICENGHWIGRSYNCANGTCLFKNNEPNVVSFYNDLEIREDVVEFPPGATIISRCTDIGKYELVGSIERTCIHSEWTGTKPVCNGLNQENDYAMEKAPTILFRHQNGPIAQSNDGKLIVYPGTTLHMECLWMRRFGNPKWSVNHNYRNYSEGWVTDEGRDATLEYRLTISNAEIEDSGIYSCQTPARHEHSVQVVIKSIKCPEIPMRRGLIVNTNDTKLSSRVLLSCSNGNSLIGSSELFCLPSGNWSAPLPVCESVECGDIPLPSNISSPRVSVLSREVGGRAAFSCGSGYGLRGPSEAVCLPTGEWSTPFPSCVEVQCDNPGAPQNGYAQGTMPYRAGDVIQFNCNPEYMMQGQPIIACQDNGRWSGGLPKCVQACSYPGTAISGHMSSVQFYYAIGESITFTCDAGLELRGPKMVKCLKNGKWSGAIPQCVTASD